MQCEQLLSGLIKRGDEEQELCYQLHLLAISCLDTAIELGYEVRIKVEKRLAQLIPPRISTDAKALAAAGVLAVKHLKRKQYYNASIRALCIRTLAMIGGEAALELLKEYATDTVDIDTKELLKAWEEFDTETHALQVLSKMDRSGEFIYLTYLPPIDKIQLLVSLTDKNSLWLASMRLKDLRLFRQITGLTSLKVTNCYQIEDLNPLAGLTSLTTLVLVDFSLIEDLSPLAGLTSLTTLDVTGCSLIKDLSPLTGLSSLKVFNGRVWPIK